MKAKTIFVIACIIVFSNIISYYIGSHDIYMAKDVGTDGTESMWYPHSDNIREALSFEREYANALMEGLHRFYADDDNDLWFNGFVYTREYEKIDSLNNHDWKDFYYYESAPIEDWFITYGTVKEPSPAYKDTITTEQVRNIHKTYNLALNEIKNSEP